MFVRTGATLLAERDCPNPNPKGSPYKNMAELTWRNSDGSITISYGCRRTFAQFPNKPALFKYIGKTFNGKGSGLPYSVKKRRPAKRTHATSRVMAHKQVNLTGNPDIDFLNGIGEIINGYSRELAEWKARARKAEAQLETLRKALRS